MPQDDEPPPELAESLYRSFERLKAAGIVKEFTREVAGQGHIRWSDDAFTLLQAGRRFETDPGFRRAWATGDPLVVRRWVAGEAAAIRARAAKR
jgi:hypothetical protein